MHQRVDQPRRAAPLEVVGAWLGVWTAPRDVVVPPVPWRRLALGAALAAVVVGVAAALLVPRIDAAKERRSAGDAAALASERAAARARILREQAPHRLAAPDLRARPGATPASAVAAQEALVARVQRGIAADAAARSRRGELPLRTGPASCAPFPPGAPPERRAGARIGVYDCLVETSRVPSTQDNPEGRIGYPFRAVVDFRAGSAAWCKTNPAPGEQVIPDPRTVIELPSACRAPRDGA